MLTPKDVFCITGTCHRRDFTPTKYICYLENGITQMESPKVTSFVKATFNDETLGKVIILSTFRPDCMYLKYSHCLKIIQNVSFEFFNFGFSDSKTRQNDLFGQNVSIARFARIVE